MNTEQIINFMKGVPLLSNLEQEELNELVSVCTVKEFNKGKIIFYEEDHGTSLYIIVTGQVKISIVSGEGKEHILGIMKENEFFGEISLLDGEPRSTSVIALSKVKLLIIKREGFIKILRNNPEMTFKIILAICKRIRWADHHVSNLAFLSAHGRVAKTLMYISEQSGVKQSGKIYINHKMTRQEMAGIAGTSRETFTRIIMQFQDEGLIKASKSEFVILKPKELEERII